MASLGTFVAAAHREPDLAEELDRVDEAAEAEVDEEKPSPAQQRQLLRAHVNVGAPNNWRILNSVAHCGMGDAAEESSDGQYVISMCIVRGTTDAENSAGSSLAEMLPFQSSLWHRHNGSSESAGSRKIKSEYRTSSAMGHVTTRAHAGRTLQLQRPLPHCDDSGSITMMQ